MTSSWKNTAGGSWDKVDNWFGGVPDSSTSDATISLAGNYAVTLDDGETFTVRDMTLANADATFTLSGTLNARRTVTVSDGTFIDNGLLDLSASGAALHVNGGVFKLSDGTIKGGTLSTSGGGVLQSTNFVNTFDGTVDGGVTVTAGTTVEIPDICSLVLAGSINNFGTFAMSSAGDNTRLFIKDTVTLTGGGTIALSDDIHNAILSDVSGATSTLINVDNTISGGGIISGDNTPAFGTLAFVNKAAGVINASSATAALTIGDIALTNNGLIEATGAGGLSLQGVTFGLKIDQSGGGVLKSAGADAHVDILIGTTITGGTLASSGGGSFTISGGSNLFDGTVAGGFTLTKGTRVDINDQPGHIGSLNLDGAIKNNGTIALNSTGDNVRLFLNHDVKLTGGGQIALGDSPSNVIMSGLTGVAVKFDNVDNLISGAGAINGDSTPGFGTIALHNHDKGIIRATSATNALTISDMTLTNDGLVEAKGAGGLILSNVTLDDTGGGKLRALGKDAHVDLINTTIEGGDIAAGKSSTIRILNFTNIFDGTVPGGLTIAAGSHIEVADVCSLHLAGMIANSGTIELAGTSNNTNLLIDGKVTLKGGGDIVLDDGPNHIATFVAGSSVNNIDNTISGAGSLGTLSFGLVNGLHGTIDASEKDVLLIEGPMTNKGLLEATGSGGLQINGILKNSGIIRGVITQNGDQTIISADQKSEMHLTGGTGNNVLKSSGGDDVLTGGAGKDTFLFNSKLGPDNVDHITDFSHKDDTIALDSSVFKHLSGHKLDEASFKDLAVKAEDGNDHILYDHDSGKLYYDVDGKGGEDKVLFAVLDGHPHDVNESDFALI